MIYNVVGDELNGIALCRETDFKVVRHQAAALQGIKIGLAVFI